MFRMIGKGTYGCVYKPSLSCSDGTYTSQENHVSKLMPSKFASAEHKLQSRVDDIDPNSIFHYPIIKTCVPDYIPKKCSECEPGDARCLETCCDTRAGLKDLHMLVYEDGGKPLIEALKDPSLNMDMLYKGLWRLFFGLYVIHNNDLYHLDIKSDNVLVQITPDEYTIKYIDFGIMKTSEEVLKNYTNFEQVQANQPSEIVAIHEIMTHISTIGQKITKNYIIMV